MSDVSKMPMIYKAMANVMLEVGSIGKEQKNNHQGFMFRGIDDVYNHLQFILAKNGVVSVPSKIIELDRQQITTSNGKPTNRICATVEYTFYAEDGSSITTEVLTEAMDTGDKASPKAMSIAHKYTFIQSFSIPVHDIAEPDRDSYMIDKQSEGLELINNDQVDVLENLITEKNVKREAFIGWLGKQKIAKSIVKIPAKHFDMVKEALDKK